MEVRLLLLPATDLAKLPFDGSSCAAVPFIEPWDAKSVESIGLELALGSRSRPLVVDGASAMKADEPASGCATRAELYRASA